MLLRPLGFFQTWDSGRETCLTHSSLDASPTRPFSSLGGRMNVRVERRKGRGGKITREGSPESWPSPPLPAALQGKERRELLIPKPVQPQLMVTESTATPAGPSDSHRAMVGEAQATTSVEGYSCPDRSSTRSKASSLPAGACLRCKHVLNQDSLLTDSGRTAGGRGRCRSIQAGRPTDTIGHASWGASPRGLDGVPCLGCMLEPPEAQAEARVSAMCSGGREAPL